MPSEPSPRQVYARSRAQFEHWMSMLYGHTTVVDYRIPRPGDKFVGACGGGPDLGELGNGRGFESWWWEEGFVEPTGPRIILSEKSDSEEGERE